MIRRTSGGKTFEKMAAIKDGLLKELNDLDVQEFYQLDGWVPDPLNKWMEADEDGRCITKGYVHDLRHTHVDFEGLLFVRVQITPGTTLKEAVTLLEKMVDKLKAGLSMIGGGKL